MRNSENFSPNIDEGNERKKPRKKIANKFVAAGLAVGLALAGCTEEKNPASNDDNTPLPSNTPTETVGGAFEPTATAAPIEDLSFEDAVATAVQSTMTAQPQAETLAPTEISEENIEYSLELSDYFNGPILFSGWTPVELSPNGEWFTEHTASDNWDNVSETWKRAAEGCTIPAACNVYGPSGVLGADDYEEAEANASAVWTGSMWHGSPDNSESEFSILCPEGSYCDMYALQFGQVLIGPADKPYIELNIPSCGENCGQGLLIRNWLARPGVDLNTTVRVRDYGEPGAASWTEYNVPPEAAEYFSQDYATAQAINAHAQNNNGSGPEDNKVFIQHVLDLNDGTYTILGHEEGRGWFEIWSNVVSYGNH